MAKAGITPVYKKVFYTFGGLFSCVEVFFALFFVSYVVRIGIPFYVSIPLTLISLLLPLALMPLLYDIINGSPLISLGKYHIPFLISIFLAAISCASVFNTVGMGLVASTIVVFIGLFVFVLSALIFEYSYFSIGVRMFFQSGQGKLGFIPRAVGAAIVVLLATIFKEMNFLAYSNISYILGAIIIVVAVLVYLSTFYAMPKFIRVEPPKKRPICDKYKFFYNLFSSKKNLRVFFGFYLLEASAIILLICLMNFVGANTIFSLLWCVCSFIVFKTIFSFVEKKKEILVPICIAGASLQLLVIALGILSFMINKEVFTNIYFICSFVILGYVLAAFFTAGKSITNFLVSNSVSSIGRVRNIINMFFVAAFFVMSALLILYMRFTGMIMTLLIYCICAVINIIGVTLYNLRNVSSNLEEVGQMEVGEVLTEIDYDCENDYESMGNSDVEEE